MEKKGKWEETDLLVVRVTYITSGCTGGEQELVSTTFHMGWGRYAVLCMRLLDDENKGKLISITDDSDDEEHKLLINQRFIVAVCSLGKVVDFAAGDGLEYESDW